MGCLPAPPRKSEIRVGHVFPPDVVAPPSRPRGNPCSKQIEIASAQDHAANCDEKHASAVSANLIEPPLPTAPVWRVMAGLKFGRGLAAGNLQLETEDLKPETALCVGKKSRWWVSVCWEVRWDRR